MKARFTSRCPICKLPIKPGDEIQKTAYGSYGHVTHPKKDVVSKTINFGPTTVIADPAIERDAIKWIDPPKIPDEFWKITADLQDDMRHKIDRQLLYGANPKKKDDMAITAMDYHDVMKDVGWDSKLMERQFYYESPLLDMIEGKTNHVTIPLEKKMTELDTTSPKSLRKKADQIEAVRKQAKKAAKKQRKQHEREAARTELAKQTLAEIAADKKARKEDRVEAARVLLDRSY